MGTGTYLVNVNLFRRLPNIFSQKVQLSHEGINKSCKNVIITPKENSTARGEHGIMQLKTEKPGIDKDVIDGNVNENEVRDDDGNESAANQTVEFWGEDGGHEKRDSEDVLGEENEQEI
jgi:hypothetical protein